MLLLQDKGLVKTKNFGAPRYVGDPINAVRIFNEKHADELCVFDIDASTKGYTPDYNLIEKLAGECRMPLCYGGGVKTSDQALQVLRLGVEKVALSSSAVEHPNLLRELADKVGSQSVVVVLDLKKTMFGGLKIVTHNATRVAKHDPFEFVKCLNDLGAGELILNFVDADGCMNGYDIKAIQKFKDKITIPLTVAGGCGSSDDLTDLIRRFGPIGCAAGSYFVFRGKYRAVLISYPNSAEKHALLQ